MLSSFLLQSFEFFIEGLRFDEHGFGLHRIDACFHLTDLLAEVDDFVRQIIDAS